MVFMLLGNQISTNLETPFLTVKYTQISLQKTSPCQDLILVISFRLHVMSTLPDTIETIIYSNECLKIESTPPDQSD